MDEIVILEPRTIILTILWVEIGIGVMSMWLRPLHVESNNIVTMVTLLLLIVTIFYHCLSDVIPLYVESRVPCFVGRHANQSKLVCLGVISKEN